MAMTTNGRITRALRDIESLLHEKNDSYGDAALSRPLLVPGGSPSEGLRYRLGEKIARLAMIFREPKTRDGISLALEQLDDVCGCALLLRLALENELACCDNERRER